MINIFPKKNVKFSWRLAKVAAPSHLLSAAVSCTNHLLLPRTLEGTPSYSWLKQPGEDNNQTSVRIYLGELLKKLKLKVVPKTAGSGPKR